MVQKASWSQFEPGKMMTPNFIGLSPVLGVGFEVSLARQFPRLFTTETQRHGEKQELGDAAKKIQLAASESRLTFW
jgi:hypothetical protein